MVDFHMDLYPPGWAASGNKRVLLRSLSAGCSPGTILSNNLCKEISQWFVFVCAVSERKDNPVIGL